MADIGTPVREVEFEPVKEPVREPAPERVPEPEKVPLHASVEQMVKALPPDDLSGLVDHTCDERCQRVMTGHRTWGVPPTPVPPLSRSLLRMAWSGLTVGVPVARWAVGSVVQAGRRALGAA